MNPLEALIRNRWVQSGLALFVLVCGIWFGGAHLAYGDYRPLALAAVRITLIAVLIIFWIGALVLTERRRGVAARDGARKVQFARFAAVTAILRGRRQTRLPWYVLLSGEKAGTSTWLPQAGFDPLHVRRDVPADTSFTSCDWWCDGHAVMVDIDTQEPVPVGDPASASLGWSVLLAALAQARGRHTVGGVIVVAALPVMGQGQDVVRRRLAASLRVRLDDVRAHVGEVPVYVLFTMADRLTGFIESFRMLDDEQHAQVWGATLSLDESEGAGLASRFDQAMEELADRLDRQLMNRLHLASTPGEARRQLDFPQELRCHAVGMREFVERVLGARTFGDMPRFRGFYLVSSTQEGEASDEVSHALRRAFGIRACGPSWGTAPPRSYFAGRLSSLVWVPEAGLARGTGWKRRMRWRWIGAACAASITLIAVLATIAGYRQNTQLVTEVDRMLQVLKEGAGTSPAGTYSEYYARVLERLDVLDRAERLVTTRGESFPSLGLSQSERLLAMIRSARQREIGHNLLPGLFGQFRAALDSRADDPRRLYFALKGYLMLTVADRFDTADLENLAREEWRAIFPRGDGLVGALAGHLRRYDARSGMRHVFPADVHLVEVTRASLRVADIATLVYMGLKLEEGASSDSFLRLDRTLGLLGDTFVRRGGAPLSEPLPGLYTRTGFARMMGGERDGKVDEGEIARASARFAADAWVFGENGHLPGSHDDLQDRVKAIYIADYKQAWDALIGDLELQPVADLAQAGAMATRLSGPASPLRALLLLVKEHTEGLDGDRGETSIAEHFSGINQLTKGQPGMQPIDRISATLDEVGKRLAGATREWAEQESVLVMARLETAAMPAPLSGWIQQLLGSSKLLVDDGWDAGLRKSLRDAAGEECVHMVRNRYPFVVESPNDIPLHDFSRLFGRGGRFDTFRMQSLLPRLALSSEGWTLRESGEDRANDVLGVSRVAEDIREAYFRESPTPGVTFSLVVDHLPEGVSRIAVDMDGQSLAYRRGEFPLPVSFTWPGPQPGLTRIHAWDNDDKPLHGLTFTGEWSWFHALDAAVLETRTQTRFGVTFLLDGKPLAFSLEALSLHHPFGGSSIRRFRCPA